MAGLIRATGVVERQPEDYKGRQALKSCHIGVSSHPLVWTYRKRLSQTSVYGNLFFVGICVCLLRIAIQGSDSLGHHGTGNLHEAGGIGTLDIVDEAVVTFAITHALVVDVLHYILKFPVNFFGTP